MRRRGNAVLEVAMWMPFLLLLVSGMIQFGRLTYLNYVLQKIVYGAARTLAVSQNLDLCDPSTVIQTILNNAIIDPSTTNPIVSDLTSDQLVVTMQCLDASGAIGTCDVSACPASPQRPDFVNVAISNGYSVPLKIPFIQLDPIVLKPSITVPFGGSSL